MTFAAPREQARVISLLGKRVSVAVNSPWQRGTNENTNGLLRQYFPKGTNMAALTQHHLDEAAYSPNTRPRQTLGWMTPSDKLAEALQ